MSAAMGVGRSREQAVEALDPANFGWQIFDGTALCGSPAQIVDQLGAYPELGITRVYLRAPARLRPLSAISRCSPARCYRSWRGCEAPS
jgi:alkanesulfonate monooxygenase